MTAPKATRRKAGRKRGPLPCWDQRVAWWAQNGAGHGTPHVPHQWLSQGPIMNCARCGDAATTGDRQLGHGRRKPPACPACAVEIDATFNRAQAHGDSHER